MDPGETLFKGLLKLWHRVRGEVDPAKPGAARLADHSDRLELLGALLFGALPDVKPAEDAGGLAGDSLLLPRRIELFEREADNELVYVYRVAFAAAARELELGSIAAGDERVGAVASLLAVPAILEHLHALYPATRALTARLAAAELAVRPAVDPRTTDGLVESLVQALLRAASSTETAAAAGSHGASEHAARWLAMSAEEGAVLPARRRANAEATWQEMCRLASRGSGPPPQVRIWGRLWPSAAQLEEHETGTKPDVGAKVGKRNSITLERTIRLERQKLGEREDKPLFHVFEKLETAEDYTGQSATPDASGNIDQMKDALNELSLGTAIRTTDDPRNLVRAEVLVEPGGLEVDHIQAVEGRVFHYPEWNHKQQAYRQSWVTLVEERLVAGDAGHKHAATAREVLRTQRRHVEDIRGHLIRTLHRRQMRNRQTFGPEIDINAMVERHSDLVAGRTPSDRLYLSARRALREIAILVLLDTSFSTDAWLQGRRVLDVEVESLLVLSAALEGVMEEEIAVASFHSNTRHDVRFGVLKGFRDPWAHLRRVAPGLEPGGYTRIGAAVRHATAVLDRAHARKKLLLIVSDGKPTDYDRYEGRYGIEDVSKAVREAGQRRIHCFGLAIESEAKLHLARMLGPGSYRVLPRTSLLPGVMADVFLGMLTD